MNPLLLIDADYFFYRAASASEDEHEYSEDVTVIVGDHRKAKSIINQEIANLKQKFKTEDVLLFFTDSKNFRKDIDPTYKGNRTKRKPAGYRKLVAWGRESYKSQMMPGLEADDVLGINATQGNFDDFVLISPDKDMLQIPCRIYDLKTEFTQTPEAAERKLYEQALTGDATDGYKGCTGVGPKKAEIILKKAQGNYWPAVLEAYLEAGQTEEDALRNLRLAKILQAPDFNFQTGRPILFTPQ
jgi:DNA polymerase-1